MSSEFLGLPFAPIEPEDRPRLAELLTRHPQPLSDYSPTSLVVWAPVCRHTYTIVEPDTLLVTTSSTRVPQPCLLQPVGAFPESVAGMLLDRGRRLDRPLQLESVSEEFLARHSSFVAHFDVRPVRDSANYIYSATELAELRGRRFASKRNLIAQASGLHAWSVERLTPKLVEACREVADDIASKRTAACSVTLDEETRALEGALQMLGPLGLHGLLLRIDGRPGAFSIVDRLSPTTAVVLFERALRREKGLYQLINRETARVLVELGFTLVNREEDLGDPGLRRAKLSYFPARLEMKYTLTLRH
ncbi:MAG TPA: phosphatidylglycerol lysyltransferase domain-containing protein [Thermoanaerobaculaceae bacterium]|nr:phosphatidylglycerol lysyltransferase domain-containing protein [Thermoanaerobaculaceae bacterium]